MAADSTITAPSSQSVTVLLAALVATHPDPVALKTAFITFAHHGEQTMGDKTMQGTTAAFDAAYAGALRLIDQRIAALKARPA